MRLRQGRAEDETAYGDDPVEMALRWQGEGAGFLHVVDLDGAFRGRPAALPLCKALAAALSVPFEIGGGLRTDEDVAAALEAGAARAIVGSRAVSDPAAAAALAARFGAERVVVGIDARDGFAQVAGWTETTAVRATDLARDLASRGVRLFAPMMLAMVFAPNQLPQYLAEKGFDIEFATADIPHNEGATGSSVGVMDRVMAFRDDAAPDQAKRNEAIGKFLKFFYDPANYVGWVSMETFLPAVNSAVGALVEADPSFEAWLNVLGNCRFYPAAKSEWADVRNGIVVDVEQRALTGEEVRPLLDALQTKIAGN